MTDKKRRRAHPAPAGRVMATGISISATLGIMAVLAANQPVWSTSGVGAGTTGTGQAGTTNTAVAGVVPRTISRQPGQTAPAAGTPVDPATTAAPAADRGGGGQEATNAADNGGGATAAPVDSGGTAPAPGPAPDPVVTVPPTTMPPTTTAPPPACTGSKC